MFDRGNSIHYMVNILLDSLFSGFFKTALDLTSQSPKCWIGWIDTFISLLFSQVQQWANNGSEVCSVYDPLCRATHSFITPLERSTDNKICCQIENVNKY